MTTRLRATAHWLSTGLSVLALVLALAPRPAAAEGLRAGSHHDTWAAAHHAGHSTAAHGVGRDSKGKIARSSQERAAFEHQHPCPATGKTTGACPGYVVDHVTPLKRGGADRPENMQWQKSADAKAKDKTE